MTAIQNLANTVIANAASRSLARCVCLFFRLMRQSLNIKDRMKSRPEYRSVFTSPTMFFRALHIISTQRYRLPVRRYVMDLFNLELNPELVAALMECAKTLKAHPSYKPTVSNANRSSMFDHLGRFRRPSESDDSEDEDELDAGGSQNGFVEELPVLNLRPVSKIIGFAF